MLLLQHVYTNLLQNTQKMTVNLRVRPYQHALTQTEEDDNRLSQVYCLLCTARYFFIERLLSKTAAMLQYV